MSTEITELQLNVVQDVLYPRRGLNVDDVLQCASRIFDVLRSTLYPLLLSLKAQGH